MRIPKPDPATIVTAAIAGFVIAIEVWSAILITQEQEEWARPNGLGNVFIGPNAGYDISTEYPSGLTTTFCYASSLGVEGCTKMTEKEAKIVNGVYTRATKNLADRLNGANR